MFFLNPKSDIAFKKLFGNAQHKDVVISFLNTILGRPEGEKIIDVSFGDTHNQPVTISSKASIVDVKCFDQKGHYYLIEMQVAPEYDFADRCLYYTSVAISGQLQRAEAYEKLVPVIFVGILNFDLFETSNYISHHFIKDNETGEHAIKGLEFHFIELKKFKKKKEEEPVGELEKWIYFLKYIGDSEEAPESLKQTKAMREALDILKRGNWSKQELEAYNDYCKGQWSQRSQIETAKREIIKNLLLKNKMTVQEIAEATGLSVDKIEEIKKELGVSQ